MIDQLSLTFHLLFQPIDLSLSSLGFESMRNTGFTPVQFDEVAVEFWMVHDVGISDGLPQVVPNSMPVLISVFLNFE